ncbi:MAG: hypothetical protein ACRDOH_18060 [Streptosporangiaceae bacterium]
MPQEFAQVVVAVFEVGGEDGQQGLAAAYPVIDALLRAPLVDGEATQRVLGDRAGGDPRYPLLGFLDRPARLD